MGLQEADGCLIGGIDLIVLGGPDVACLIPLLQSEGPDGEFLVGQGIAVAGQVLPVGIPEFIIEILAALHLHPAGIIEVCQTLFVSGEIVLPAQRILSPEIFFGRENSVKNLRAACGNGEGALHHFPILHAELDLHPGIGISAVGIQLQFFDARLCQGDDGFRVRKNHVFPDIFLRVQVLSLFIIILVEPVADG